MTKPCKRSILNESQPPALHCLAVGPATISEDLLCVEVRGLTAKRRPVIVRYPLPLAAWLAASFAPALTQAARLNLSASTAPR